MQCIRQMVVVVAVVAVAGFGCASSSDETTDSGPLEGPGGSMAQVNPEDGPVAPQEGPGASDSESVEPEEEAGERTDREMRQIAELHVQMYERRAEMLRLYDALEEAYGELKEVSPELIGRIDPMHGMYDRMSERQAILDEHERRMSEQDESGTPTDREAGAGRYYHQMMGDPAHIERITREHEEMVEFHEELAEINTDADRIEMAETHDQLAGSHVEMARTAEDLLELMEGTPEDEPAVRLWK